MTDIDLTTGTKQTFTVPGAQHPAGTAYVFDYGSDRIVKLANGSGAQPEVPPS